MNEAKEGLGVDRHLFGLKQLAYHKQQRLPNYKIPAIFTDKSYSTLGTPPSLSPALISFFLSLFLFRFLFLSSSFFLFLLFSPSLSFSWFLVCFRFLFSRSFRILGAFYEQLRFGCLALVRFRSGCLRWIGTRLHDSLQGHPGDRLIFPKGGRSICHPA